MSKLGDYLKKNKAKLILADIEKKMMGILEESLKNGEETLSSHLGNFEYSNRSEMVTEITGISILKYKDDIVSKYTYGTAEPTEREIFNFEKIIEIKKEFDEDFKSLKKSKKTEKKQKFKL